jgi:hypothetical protein
MGRPSYGFNDFISVCIFVLIIGGIRLPNRKVHGIVVGVIVFDEIVE